MYTVHDVKEHISSSRTKATIVSTKANYELLISYTSQKPFHIFILSPYSSFSNIPLWVWIC